MHPSSQLRQALSWKLLSELHRRHPGEFTVIETHPGGGQYDCLTLLSGNQTIAHLNRVGSFTLSSGESIPWEDLWPECLTDGGIAGVLDRMSEVCRFPVPAQLPSTGPETLVYRIMAGVSAALIFEKDPWEWRNGQMDSSEWDDQAHRDQWFEAFPGAKEAARVGSPDQPFGNPKYGFWFLLKNDQPMVCLSKTALCWDTGGGETNLAEQHHRDRRIHALVGSVLSKLK